MSSSPNSTTDHAPARVLGGIYRLFLSPAHNYFGHHGMPAGDHAMIGVGELRCVAGRGIEGDRFFDYKPDYKGQITFFMMEHLVEMWNELELPPERRCLAATRRNVLTRGIDLSEIIGKRFELGGVLFEGVEECRPCYWMNEAIHPRAEEWMKGRGGLRARIITSGTLRCSEPEPVSLAAALLAGGSSRRMGQDKATLLLGEERLWQRGLRLLRGVAWRVGVAAPSRPVWLKEEVRWIADAVEGRGPLAGLLGAMRWAQRAGHSHLLVLPVDTPCMTPEFLQRLTQLIALGRGVVPSVDGHYEPLVGIYPVDAVALLQAAAEHERWKLQDLVSELVAFGAVTNLVLQRGEGAPLTNVNTQQEWSAVIAGASA